MFWDKKKKEEGLPDLPPSTTLPPSIRDYKRDMEPRGLPSFPDSPIKKGFSQAAIKDAVETTDMNESHEELPRFHEPVEMPQHIQQNYKIMEMDEFTKPKAKTTEVKPIFVRLDKFSSARVSLNEVKQKLTEADSILKKIKDTKMKEDQELALWEKEMEAIKSRVNTIMSDIFEARE